MNNALDPAPGQAGPAKAPAQANKEAQFLLVDDSVTMRLFLRRQLESLFPACQVQEAEDGKTALRSLTTARVDLIITDLQMPGMDGQSLVQVLRRNPLLRKKPILVISAALDDEAHRDLLALGDASLGFLAKPVTPDSLKHAVSRLLA